MIAYSYIYNVRYTWSEMKREDNQHNIRKQTMGGAEF